jgi:hypothetical protein
VAGSTVCLRSHVEVRTLSGVQADRFHVFVGDVLNIPRTVFLWTIPVSVHRSLLLSCKLSRAQIRFTVFEILVFSRFIDVLFHLLIKFDILISCLCKRREPGIYDILGSVSVSFARIVEFVQHSIVYSWLPCHIPHSIISVSDCVMSDVVVN